MTLKEAEEQYKFCNGEEGYIMWHECGDKAVREYHDLKIPKEIKAQWDRDLIEENLDALERSPQEYHGFLGRVLDSMARGNCDPAEYADRTLDVLESMVDIDYEGRIRILEFMGRNSQFHADGCKLFCDLGEDYAERMDRIVRKIMDFPCPDEPIRYLRGRNMLELYSKAVSGYEESYARWRREHGKR